MQIKHNFTWAIPQEIQKDDLDKLMLIKGVCMQSGKLKSEEVMTDDNVTGGIGAMRAFAMQGLAKIDIDHYEDKLPDIYQEKYGFENGTVGTIIDAEAVKDDGKVNGEFIAMLDDDKVNIRSSHRQENSRVVVLWIM